jgi:hypothetical protein
LASSIVSAKRLIRLRFVEGSLQAVMELLLERRFELLDLILQILGVRYHIAIVLVLKLQFVHVQVLRHWATPMPLLPNPLPL